MAIIKQAKIISYCLAALLLAGCKLAIVVVEGGDVTSESGQHNCSEGSICIIEITDAGFSDTFLALANDGYEFSHWLGGENMNCGGAVEASCFIDNTGFAGRPAGEAVIASGAIFYLIPVFKQLPEEPPPRLSDDLQAKYNASCAQCHTNGTFGAPVIHNEAAWQPRLAKGLDTLVRSVKNGLGAMPRGGNCTNCSDQDLEDLITYMSGPAN